MRCHEVRLSNEGGVNRFSLGVADAELSYPRVPGFSPVTPARQRTELDEGKLQLTPLEVKQASTLIDAAATVIARVAEMTQASSVRVGIGMPGIKGVDERGIVLMNNGPRMPDFLDRLQDRLEKRGVDLCEPIRRVGDDGAYSGLGEEYAAGGRFRDVMNAYYIGGGTGIAECLKLDGRIVPMTGLGCKIPRAWELASPMGPTYETLVSVASMNAIYEKLYRPGNGPPGGFPESDAVDGNPIAANWLRSVAMLLGHLIFERLVALDCGVGSGPNDDSAAASTWPSCRIDRVVLGQRLGQIFAEPRFRPVFACHVESTLTCMIQGQAGRKAADLAGACLLGDGLRPGFLMASNLRAAPAIGAVVDATGGDRKTG